MLQAMFECRNYFFGFDIILAHETLIIRHYRNRELKYLKQFRLGRSCGCSRETTQPPFARTFMLLEGSEHRTLEIQAETFHEFTQNGLVVQWNFIGLSLVRIFQCRSRTSDPQSFLFAFSSQSNSREEIPFNSLDKYKS